MELSQAFSRPNTSIEDIKTMEEAEAYLRWLVLDYKDEKITAECLGREAKKVHIQLGKL